MDRPLGVAEHLLDAPYVVVRRQERDHGYLAAASWAVRGATGAGARLPPHRPQRLEGHEQIRQTRLFRHIQFYARGSFRFLLRVSDRAGCIVRRPLDGLLCFGVQNLHIAPPG